MLNIDDKLKYVSSQRRAQRATILPSYVWQKCLMLLIISNVGRRKSFVDDLTFGQGIVSMRVVFALRSAEIPPLFQRFVFLGKLSLLGLGLQWE